MVKVEHSILINQPAEKIFAYAADPRNDPKWQHGIVESKVSPDGPIQVGTKIMGARSLMGKKIEATAEITEYVPGRKMSFKSISGPFPFAISYVFEPNGDATRVTGSAELEATGFFKLAEGMLGNTVKKDMETSLETLKQQME